MREPLILTIKGIDLAFGLDWLPLVGSDPARLARALVRRHGATHSVMSGAAGAALGLAWLEPGRARGDGLYSGAQVFALLHPRATVAAVLDLGEHGWCALAAHEGAILARADKVYAERTLADGALDDIRQAYPKVRMLGGMDDPAGMLRLGSLADADARAVLQGARLRRAPRAWWRRPVLWGALALGLALLGPRIAALYSEAAVQASGASDLDRAWAEALAATLRSHRVHGETGTRALLASLYALPVSLAGWRLRQASCVNQAGRWLCRAQYARVALAADNRGLLGAARSDWRLDFPTMDQAWASWSPSLASMALDPQSLPGPEDHDRNWASAMQAIQSAFSKVRVETSRPLVISAPLDADRQPLPRPAHLNRYSTRGVQIAGPLRSANLLIPLTAHMAWSKAVLVIDEKSTWGSASTPINLTLDGVLYEMEAAEHPRA